MAEGRTVTMASGKMDKCLDKSSVLDYIFLYDKGNDEEEYASPLERESGCPVFSAEDGR